MNGRILVIEDHEDNRRILRDLLTHAGFDLLEATTGEQGVALAETEHPDLILMDMRMPAADAGKVSDRAGLDATTRLKADPSTARIPIIALTGHTMHKWKEAVLAAGCAELLDKPIVDFAVLLGAIDRNMKRKGAE